MPITASGYLQRGIERFESGAYDQAMEDFDEAIRRTSDYAKAFYYRALLKFRREDYQGAMADAASAVGFKKNDYPAAISLFKDIQRQVAQKQRLMTLEESRDSTIDFRDITRVVLSPAPVELVVESSEHMIDDICALPNGNFAVLSKPTDARNCVEISVYKPNGKILCDASLEDGPGH